MMSITLIRLWMATSLVTYVVSPEPLTSSMIGFTLAALGYTMVGCYFKECCTDNWINSSPKDMDQMLHNLTNRVYGQEYAINKIHRLVKSFIEERTRGDPMKPLVISIHGPTGTGKNFVSDLITLSILKEGFRSHYFQRYMSTHRFPKTDVTSIEQYTNEMMQEIEDKLQECPKQIFVFDEIDRMPPKILNALTPFTGYKKLKDSKGNPIVHNQAIFILLSNVGAITIESYAYEMYKRGKERGVFNERKMEEMIKMSILESDSGFKESTIILKDHIDHYIPFFPLELDHVRSCANYYMETHFGDITPEDRDIVVRSILEQVSFSPNKLYVLTGCKRIHQNIKVFMMDYRPNGHLSDDPVTPRQEL